MGYFPGGTAAFEYQTAGNNDTLRLMNKRQTAENRYGRVFFIGNSESVPELKKALNDDEIVIHRGLELENLIDQLIHENAEPEKSNLTVIKR